MGFYSNGIWIKLERHTSNGEQEIFKNFALVTESKRNALNQTIESCELHRTGILY